MARALMTTKFLFASRFFIAETKNYECPEKIQSEAQCQEAVDILGLKWDGVRNWADRQYGCLWTKGDKDVNWNTNRNGKGTHDHQVPVCIAPNFVIAETKD